jgi:hypothetical protein
MAFSAKLPLDGRAGAVIAPRIARQRNESALFYRGFLLRLSTNIPPGASVIAIIETIGASANLRTLNDHTAALSARQTLSDASKRFQR